MKTAVKKQKSKKPATKPKVPLAPLGELNAFVHKGMRAQKAVDQAIADAQDPERGRKGPVEIRRCIRDFAEHMERRLRKADVVVGAGGAKDWPAMGLEELVQGLKSNLMKATAAINRDDEGFGNEVALRNAVDVGNFAMFIFQLLSGRKYGPRGR